MRTYTGMRCTDYGNNTEREGVYNVYYDHGRAWKRQDNDSEDF